MASDMNPEFLTIEHEPTLEEIRSLLHELKEVGVTERTGRLFASMSLLKPAERLATNLGALASIMAEQNVTNVLEDGLLFDERSALLELDVQGVTIESRITARALLHVKERWFVAKATSGFFATCREEGGFIQLNP